MPPRKNNPITQKILELIASRKTTKEKICVATDLRYHTFQNIFTRPTVSYTTLKALKWAGIITEKDEREYIQWVQTNIRHDKAGRPRVHRKKAVEIVEKEPSILLEGDENELTPETGNNKYEIEGKNNTVKGNTRKKI